MDRFTVKIKADKTGSFVWSDFVHPLTFHNPPESELSQLELTDRHAWSVPLGPVRVELVYSLYQIPVEGHNE